MHRRSITVLLAAPLLTLAPAPAHAVVVDPLRAGIDLDTTATVSGDVLTITAVGAFTSTFIENTTVALHVAGTESYTDYFGNPQVVPLAANPVSIRFASSNTVTATFDLHPGSTVDVSYSAEVAGLTPTTFTGHCAGHVVRFFGGSPGVVKTC